MNNHKKEDEMPAHNLRLSELGLTEIKALRDETGRGWEIEFLSRGLHHQGMKPKAVLSCGGRVRDEVIIGDYPAWVRELAGERVPEAGHFTLRFNTAAPEAAALELIEERLLFLAYADIYRDGGSLEACWETNYGNTWELYLKVLPTLDDVLKYEHLFLRYPERESRRVVVLKGSAEEKHVMTWVDAWLDSTVPELHVPVRELMRKLSRLESLYHKMYWRMY
ncbi:hypothetical protein [Taibaiella chishuiensis]|uniref:Uncharacterized protein n=1 Tax=Taibaiella chishuiensis TaxID=1434707 RepID=A0A2P8D474_9BACT|nr:hypothetical protein [Taibaiella chishuiensis]PSK92028.1 hypothetical protein B0I18_104122 [Taibaiella chishuiensis]